MTCLEAQSNIIAYIEGELDKDTRIDFLKHIKSCDNCREELDIYYTMIEGMHQLDSNLPFSAELENRINRELKQEKKKKDFFRSSVLIVVLGVLGTALVGYVNFLNLLHSDEQNKLKEKQGEYYYSENFDDIIFKREIKLINIDTEPEITEEKSFYEKIREYNALNNLK